MVTYKPVPAFPDYRVGDDGTLWSQASGEWRQLVGGVDKDGYRKAILCCSGQRKYVRIHALVLEVFSGEHPPGKVAAHKDGSRQNNQLSNLKWKTQKENIADKLEHGTAQRGEQGSNAKLTEQQVLAIRVSRKCGALLDDLAAQYGVTKSTICAIATRRLWKHVA